MFFPPTESIVSVAVAGFALSATPGPSMLYVLSRTVGQSRTAGIVSALGLCFGGILLALATALGLASVFAAFDGLADVLRYLGAAYLAWLGIGMIREARTQVTGDFLATGYRQRPLSQIFLQGILVEALNPKTVLFFALFLPPFITADATDAGSVVVTVQLLVLGVLVPLTAVPADVFVAYMGGSMTKMLSETYRTRLTFACIGGAILVGIALGLLWQTFS
jgi:threonine/homoserine/homoserine lactone efflux protein